MKISDIQATIVDQHLAWIAGFFDGEGCITCSNTGVTVKISHTHKQSLEFIKSILGGSLNSRTGTNKPAWVWSVSGDNAWKVLQTLLPFLHEKAEQADVALELLRTRNKRGQKVTKEILFYRKQLKQKLSDLKL